ncbi:retrovirus-related pol polyprotein from transposon TNT 1-94 [Tanacetum coccineum]|uniref:Retrovirus-related pol polyprotein from transposon TNT 1-94 n=1 Tax=Tanacetum coccineum TaxID=301880 RepID=A0ABQ4YFN3_9ASTR
MDENGVVIRNKARLIEQGYKQEEGIEYDETFIPVSRLKTIKIFLAYAAYIGFVVYQMDVKSAFLNGKLFEELADYASVKCPMLPPNNLGPDESGLFVMRLSLEEKYFRGCQILGGKLVCWSEKKQNSVAMSFDEAEYVAVAGCCAQVLWIKSQLADYDILYDRVPIFCDNASVISISNNQFCTLEQNILTSCIISSGIVF